MGEVLAPNLHHRHGANRAAQNEQQAPVPILEGDCGADFLSKATRALEAGRRGEYLGTSKGW